MAIINSQKRTKTICVTSGKGGVGKTTITANLAFALAKRGKRVLILDGDLGMANVDIMFGVRAEKNIYDVLSGDSTIQEVITSLYPQIDLISGGNGLVELNRLSPFERRALVESVQALDSKYDYLLIDSATGMSENVLYFNSAAQVPVFVITPDPASISDAYSLMKILHRDYKENKFAIICNQVRDDFDGMSLYNRYNEVVSRFLVVGLDYWGSLSQDLQMRKSTQTQRLIMKHEPTSQSARQIMNIADKLEQSLVKSSEKSGLQFFWEQVVGVA